MRSERYEEIMKSREASQKVIRVAFCLGMVVGMFAIFVFLIVLI